MVGFDGFLLLFLLKTKLNLRCCKLFFKINILLDFFIKYGIVFLKDEGINSTLIVVNTILNYI